MQVKLCDNCGKIIKEKDPYVVVCGKNFLYNVPKSEKENENTNIDYDLCYECFLSLKEKNPIGNLVTSDKKQKA